MQLLLIDRLTWVRFVGVLKALSASEVGGRAIALFALLILLLFVISGLNVVNSYVGRDFMTAIANRNMAGFIWQAKIYIGVFAASTAVAVLSRFTEESLGRRHSARSGELSAAILKTAARHPSAGDHQ